MRAGLDTRTVMRFVIVGGTTAALFYGLVYLFYEVLAWPILLASSLSCALALGFNYQLHYRWTFASEASHRQALGRYLVMSGCSVLINSTLMYVGVELWNLHLWLAQTVAALAMILWNIVLSRYWVYR